MNDDEHDQPDLFTLTRKGDPVTSYEAAAAMYGDLRDIQTDVLKWATNQPDGFIDRDMVDGSLGRIHGPSTLRTRRSELCVLGMIHHHRDAEGKPLYRIVVDRKTLRHSVWIMTPYNQIEIERRRWAIDHPKKTKPRAEE